MELELGGVLIIFWFMGNSQSPPKSQQCSYPSPPNPPAQPHMLLLQTKQQKAFSKENTINDSK